MGKTNTQFRASWLTGEDNGFKRSEWLKRLDGEHVFCTVCSCSVKFSTQGGQAISSHAKTIKHLDNCRTKLTPSQLHLEGRRPREETNSIGTETPATLQIYSVRRKSTVAEIYWALKCVASNFPASSNEDMKDLFSCMFGENEALGNYSMGRTKFSYVVTDGLAPYFRDQLISDLSGQYYSMYYDETTNDADSKELRTGVRFWSEREGKVISAHLKTYFIQKATGEDLSEKILSALDVCSLPFIKLIMQGSDGPSVNKKVNRIINEQVKLCRDQPLLDIGTCNIHIAHNAYRKGLEVFGDESADLITLVYNFFDGWPSRWKYFEDIQAELGLKRHKFIKHLPARWLTLEPAASRILEQWPALIKLFVTFIPKEKPQFVEKSSYIKIRRLLLDKTTRAQLIFVRNTAQIFTSFTRFFQREEPLIHILHSELRTVALTLLNRVSKPEVVQDRGVCTASLEPDNLLPLS